MFGVEYLNNQWKDKKIEVTRNQQQSSFTLKLKIEKISWGID
jgi:hypothetical protein